MDVSAHAKKFAQPSMPRPGQAGSDWEEQLDRFYFRMKKELSHGRIAKLLSGIGIHDAGAAHVFYEKVERDAKNFTALFNHLTGNIRKKKA